MARPIRLLVAALTLAAALAAAATALGQAQRRTFLPAVATTGPTQSRLACVQLGLARL
ncbi:MAG: hypothetical protein HGA45_40285, partial [Chloroflexales bacterium]|nr:hypothetical protein [Chloroflexales bacterium]